MSSIHFQLTEPRQQERPTVTDATFDETGLKRELSSLLPRLRRFALGLCTSRDDADDLVQIALERALVRLDTFQPGTRLDSWMFRIIRNARIDQVRQERVRPAQYSLDEGENGSYLPHVPSGIESAVALETVLESMRNLSDDHREIITLVCIEGMRYREAADILGVSLGTVMSRLARARINLLRQLGDDTGSGYAALRN